MAHLKNKSNLANEYVTISVQLRASEENKSLWEARESALEQKIEDNDEKILKLESYWLEAQDLCKGLNEQLAETQAQYETLDKKYNKAKKLLKDYQQKWVTLLFTVGGINAVWLWFIEVDEKYFTQNLKIQSGIFIA